MVSQDEFFLCFYFYRGLGGRVWDFYRLASMDEYPEVICMLRMLPGITIEPISVARVRNGAIVEEIDLSEGSA